MSTYLVCGAGGFIGGHLVKRLMEEGHNVVCADVKPLEFWFQIYDQNKNFSLDLKESENCDKVTEGVDYIYNMACNMGGMGFIENNKAECMLSVLINTNMLRSCIKNKVKYFFFQRLCLQCAKTKRFLFQDLKKSMHIQLNRRWIWFKKLFSERMCRHFSEDFGLETRVVRYHNVYGPIGTYDGGREKAPAALCRKIINAKLNNLETLDVWGDGKQTRSFLYISDCLDGTEKIFNSDSQQVYNVGSSEQVSINQMIDIIEDISEIKLKRNYQLDKPKGVRGRSSDNTKINDEIGWIPSINLKTGLEKTYKWIYDEVKSGSNLTKFTRSY